MSSVLGVSDYKDFIQAMIQEQVVERGYLAQLAKAAGCQRSFFSQVLHSHVHLTPDHAMGLALFWDLPEVEREYFLELLHYARSGSEQYRKVSIQKLKRLKEDAENLSRRLKRESTMTQEAQIAFYSHWYVSAVHLLLTISNFRTAEAISKRLNIKLEEASRSLLTLEQIGLARRERGMWLPTDGNLHLPRNSPMAFSHHSNWRGRAVADVIAQTPESMHYTSLYSLNRDDFEKIKSLVLALVESSRSTAVASSSEDLACFNLDWFWV
jgi:uncharacterized protein (TIGR02147 family)